MPTDLAKRLAQDALNHMWIANPLERDTEHNLTVVAVSIDAGMALERARCAAVVNDARFEGHTDLRSLVSRIENPETTNK